MSAHLSNEIVERFHAQVLAGGDRSVIYDHILSCESCRQRVVDSKTTTIALDVMVKHLLPGEEDEPYHLSYETIEAFVNDKLDLVDRHTVNLHLDDCDECSIEVADLRESLATMKAASSHESEYRNGQHVRTFFPSTRIPMRIAAMVALVAVAIVALVVVWRLKSPGPEHGRDVTVGSQPTPFPSAPANTPAISPSPSLGASPSLAENGSTEVPSEPGKETVVALNDGPNQIALDKSGNVSGLDSLPPEARRAVKDALEGERLKRPDALDEVGSAQVTERAQNGSEERVGIVYPVSAVIEDTQPKLRWRASKTAQAYRIEIADEGFRQVAKSQDLPATTLTWAPTTPLKRGMVYTWTIRAVNQTGELSSVSSLGKFKVLGEGKVKELSTLKSASQSHLARGLFYAREGMVADAAREFRILLRENPNSPIARKLLSDVQSWQKR